MNKKIIVPTDIRDTKNREYLEHLHEIIERQSNEISAKNQLLQIQNLNIHQDLDVVVHELLGLLWGDQFNCIRIIIKIPDDQFGDALYSKGKGNKSDSYAYLDNQIEEQLGNPGVLYISDTSKIHSIKFLPGYDFPKTILGISFGEEKEKNGLVWFACENQKYFSKHESDTLISLVRASSKIIKDCIEWNERNITLNLRNEILDQVNFPIFILSKKIIYSNQEAKNKFRLIFEDHSKSQELINTIWKLSEGGEKHISINNSEYLVKLIDSNYFSPEKVKAVIFSDETLIKNQRNYLKVVVNSISQSLRSTLNLIQGSVKMLPLVGEVNEHQKDYLNAIHSKTTDSINVIEDLLEIERIIADDGLKLASESLNHIINNSILLVSYLAKQKHITLINKTPDSAVMVNLDKTLFSQMLACVFEFAISQTQLNGEISVETEKNNNIWNILIKDKSSGLSQVEVDRLNSRDQINEIPQTLRLARKIIDFHKGTFLLKSDLGKGNIYLIKIPQ